MITAIGSVSTLSSVRQSNSVTAAPQAGGASAPNGATPAQTGARGERAGQTLDAGSARTVLAAQEQSNGARPAGGGGQSAASASSSSTTDTLTPLEEQLDTNGDGVIDWRDYVSNDDAEAIATPSVTGYTATGGAVTASVGSGKAVSLVA